MAEIVVRSKGLQVSERQDRPVENLKQDRQVGLLELVAWLAAHGDPTIRITLEQGSREGSILLYAQRSGRSKCSGGSPVKTSKKHRSRRKEGPKQIEGQAKRDHDPILTSGNREMNR